MNIKRFERYSCIFFVMIGFVAAYIIGYKIGSEEESNVILRNEIESEMPYISKEYVSEEETERKEEENKENGEKK